MSRDPELDRLFRVKTEASQRQQTAYEEMKRAGEAWRQANAEISKLYEKKKAAQEATSRAFEKKKPAQEATSRAFEAKKAAQDEQNRLFEQKKPAQDATSRAFERKKAAQDAYFREKGNVQSRRDSLSASVDANRREAEKHRAQADYLSGQVQWARDKYARQDFIRGARLEREIARGYSQDARMYVDQIRSLGSNLASYRTAKDNAQAEFDAAKRRSDALRTQFDAARNRTQAARAEFDRLKRISDAARAEFDAAKRISDPLKAEFDRLKQKVEPLKRARDAANAAFNDAKAETQRARQAYDVRREQVFATDRGSGNGAYRIKGPRSEYYEERDDGNIDVFPNGLPRARHEDIPHPHTVTDRNGDTIFKRE